MSSAALLLLTWTLSAFASGLGERMVREALALLDTPYAAATLVGGAEAREQLVCRADSFDCMTFLATVVSRGLPGDPCENLRQWRYREGLVEWSARRHFFSDWLDHECLVDAASGWPWAVTHTNRLNDRGEDLRWLPGLPIRMISGAVAPADRRTLAALQDGDLVGFHSPLPGLDVSHVGLIRREGDRVLLLHASSRSGRVVEEELQDHPAWPKGLRAFRWKPSCAPAADR